MLTENHAREITHTHTHMELLRKAWRIFPKRHVLQVLIKKKSLRRVDVGGMMVKDVTIIEFPSGRGGGEQKGSKEW